MELYDKGRRSFIYIDHIKNKKIAIKKRRTNIQVKNHLINEAKWLKILNKYNIGPKLIKSNKDQITYEFIEGKFFLDWYKKSNQTLRKKIIKNLFLQLRILDKLKVNKEEMHHPLKHIIIKNNKPYLIDFERAHLTNKPKNITQFCQFLTSKAVNIKVNPKKVRSLLKEYKTNYKEKTFKKILKLFT